MRRAAFSVIELMVVVSLIGLLVSLVLPAVQSSRRSAVRLSCQNNLKQIGLAAGMHCDTFGKLPNGYGSTDWHKPSISWRIPLLPFIEQEGAYAQMLEDFQQFPNAVLQDKHRIETALFAVYGCPADSRVSTVVSVPTIHLADGEEYRTALSSYLGNQGLDYTRRDGVLYAGSAVRYEQITDGLSNTLLVGERPPSKDLRFGWIYTGVGLIREPGTGDHILGVREVNLPDQQLSRCSPGPYTFRYDVLDNPCSTLHYWSFHYEGANFALCDGSVRFIRYEAESILPALASRSGGEVAVLD